MKRHGLLEIHIAVILFGLSGLFGKFLTLPPLVIVFGRTFFATLTLGIILAVFKIPFRVKSSRDFFVLILLGVILAAHWITFFHSIQISTVAVGLLTFSTFPIFVTFMEPAPGYSVIRFSKSYHPWRILGNPIGVHICRSIHIKSKIRTHLSSDVDGMLPERNGNPDIASLSVS